MDKIIITGYDGQDARLIFGLLKNKPHSYIILVKNGNGPNKFYPNCEVRELDITDKNKVDCLVRDVEPDYFINFAGLSSNSLSWEDPESYINVNCLSVLYQLDAIKKFAKDCKYFNAGSVLQMKRDFDNRFSPRTPYAASKCCAHWFVDFYRKKYGLNACQGILSQHESELRPANFLFGKVINESLAINKKATNNEFFNPIQIRDINAQVDWSSARDVVNQIWENLQEEKLEDFIIKSGEVFKVKDLLEIVFRELGFDFFWKDGKMIVSDYLADISGMKSLILVEETKIEPQQKDKPLINNFKWTISEDWKDLDGIVKEILSKKDVRKHSREEREPDPF